LVNALDDLVFPVDVSQLPLFERVLGWLNFGGAWFCRADLLLFFFRGVQIHPVFPFVSSFTLLFSLGSWGRKIFDFKCLLFSWLLLSLSLLLVFLALLYFLEALKADLYP
jgi:hypothetical protein